MQQPTPIVFYAPAADGEEAGELLARIEATEVAHRHADLYQARWAGLDVMASAQQVGPLVRLLIELSSMDWIDMRLTNPDGSLINPERTRQLIDGFGTAADALDCEVAFKSMTVLPDGWANWDLFLPDFDRIAAHRSPRELVGAMVDFGYAAQDLVAFDESDGNGAVFGSTSGFNTAKGTVWFGERLPALA